MISDVAKSLAKAILDGDEVAVSALRDVLAETEDSLRKTEYGKVVDVSTMVPWDVVKSDARLRGQFYVVVYAGYRAGVSVGDLVRYVGHQTLVLRMRDWTVIEVESRDSLMVVPASKTPIAFVEGMDTIKKGKK